MSTSTHAPAARRTVAIQFPSTATALIFMASLPRRPYAHTLYEGLLEIVWSDTAHAIDRLLDAAARHNGTQVAR
jgi:hypothetical protein